MNQTWVISRPGRAGVAPITSTGWIEMWPCAVLTAAAMLLTGCMSGDHARQSIMWDVFLAIGGAFGVSATMERTNVANEFAQIFIQIAQKAGGQAAGLTSICKPCFPTSFHA
jgi:di/tricarboxylate transporter